MRNAQRSFCSTEVVKHHCHRRGRYEVRGGLNHRQPCVHLYVPILAALDALNACFKTLPSDRWIGLPAGLQVDPYAADACAICRTCCSNPGPTGISMYTSVRIYRKQGPVFSTMPLIQEALGWTTEDGRYVYLSDGGHFENLGLYEMIRRRCRLILGPIA